VKNRRLPKPRSGGTIVIVAHRGNMASCPENTLAAFSRAMAEGADLIETDLHVTADGVFVCLHDAKVDRTTDGSGCIVDLTYAETQRLRVNGQWPGCEGEGIPSLEDVCKILESGVHLALELKSARFQDERVCRRLADALHRFGVQRRTLVIASHKKYLRAFRSVDAEIPIGQISCSPIPGQGAELLGPVWPVLFLNPWYVRQAHARGQTVCPLDPRPNGRLWLYRKLGCDAVLTDDPASTIRALNKSEARSSRR